MSSEETKPSQEEKPAPTGNSGTRSDTGGDKPPTGNTGTVIEK